MDFGVEGDLTHVSSTIATCYCVRRGNYALPRFFNGGGTQAGERRSSTCSFSLNLLVLPVLEG